MASNQQQTRALCSCHCRRHCCTQRRCHCRCHCCTCACWLPDNFDIPNPGLGDVAALTAHRNEFIPPPACHHKGSSTCPNCYPYWLARKNKLPITSSPTDTYPNEILFYERAIWAWNWNVAPIIQNSHGRETPTSSDFILPDFSYIPIELKAPEKSTGYFKYSVLGKYVKDKVVRSR